MKKDADESSQSLVFILIGLYNGLLVFIFYMEFYPFFITALLLFIVSIGMFYFRNKGIFRNFKFFIPMLMFFSILLSLLFTQKLYVIMSGTYLNGTVVISVNGEKLGEEKSKLLKELFLNLEEYNATVDSATSTYMLTYQGEDDLDTRHIHIFKKEKLVIHGCLLGVGKGDTLEGYLLTDELLSILEE